MEGASEPEDIKISNVGGYGIDVTKYIAKSVPTMFEVATNLNTGMVYHKIKDEFKFKPWDNSMECVPKLIDTIVLIKDTFNKKLIATTEYKNTLVGYSLRPDPGFYPNDLTENIIPKLNTADAFRLKEFLAANIRNYYNFETNAGDVRNRDPVTGGYVKSNYRFMLPMFKLDAWLADTFNNMKTPNYVRNEISIRASMMVLKDNRLQVESPGLQNDPNSYLPHTVDWVSSRRMISNIRGIRMHFIGKCKNLVDGMILSPDQDKQGAHDSLVRDMELFTNRATEAKDAIAKLTSTSAVTTLRHILTTAMMGKISSLEYEIPNFDLADPVILADALILPMVCPWNIWRDGVVRRLYNYLHTHFFAEGPDARFFGPANQIPTSRTRDNPSILIRLLTAAANRGGTNAVWYGLLADWFTFCTSGEQIPRKDDANGAPAGRAVFAWVPYMQKINTVHVKSGSRAATWGDNRFVSFFDVDPYVIQQANPQDYDTSQIWIRFVNIVANWPRNYSVRGKSITNDYLKAFLRLVRGNQVNYNGYAIHVMRSLDMMALYPYSMMSQHTLDKNNISGDGEITIATLKPASLSSLVAFNTSSLVLPSVPKVNHIADALTDQWAIHDCYNSILLANSIYARVKDFADNDLYGYNVTLDKSFEMYRIGLAKRLSMESSSSHSTIWDIIEKASTGVAMFDEIAQNGDYAPFYDFVTAMFDNGLYRFMGLDNVAVYKPSGYERGDTVTTLGNNVRQYLWSNIDPGSPLLPILDDASIQNRLNELSGVNPINYVSGRWTGERLRRLLNNKDQFITIRPGDQFNYPVFVSTLAENTIADSTKTMELLPSAKVGKPISIKALARWKGTGEIEDTTMFDICTGLSPRLTSHFLWYVRDMDLNVEVDRNRDRILAQIDGPGTANITTVYGWQNGRIVINQDLPMMRAEWTLEKEFRVTVFPSYSLLASN
jgi:hypothetical protein